MRLTKTIEYTGAADACCVVTFTPLDELQHPVGFRMWPQQPYEAAALAAWLSQSRVVPHVNVAVSWRHHVSEAVAPFEGLCRDPDAAIQILNEKVQKPMVSRRRVRYAVLAIDLLYLYLNFFALDSDLFTPKSRFDVAIFTQVYMLLYMMYTEQANRERSFLVIMQLTTIFEAVVISTVVFLQDLVLDKYIFGFLLLGPCTMVFKSALTVLVLFSGFSA